METFANLLKYVLPLFMVLIVLEMILAAIMKKKVIKSMDALSSLTSGLTNTLFKTLGITIYIFSYDFLLEYFTIFPIQTIALQYFIGFIVLDFYVYWWHRWRHEYNLLWNEHLIHHSSEEYNLPVALRQTISDILNPATLLLLPAAFFGISLEVITVIGVVMLFGGFWYHTQLIGKMGFLEKIIVTPSHHRIHHAINPEYLDKNYGGILIIWDKIFGTFQEEMPHVPLVYGITRPVQTWNPIKINFLHLSLLVKDAWRTQNIKDKLRIWFMPSGWRPADVVEKFPIYYEKDVKMQKKYQPKLSVYLHVWSWMQLFATFLLLMFFISKMPELDKRAIILYAGFIFLHVYAYTSLMDKDKFAWVFELLRFSYAIAIVSYFGSWFTLDAILPNASQFMLGYFMLSSAISLGFCYFELSKQNESVKDRVAL